MIFGQTIARAKVKGFLFFKNKLFVLFKKISSIPTKPHHATQR
jgi:hypothetical protein